MRKINNKHIFYESSYYPGQKTVQITGKKKSMKKKMEQKILEESDHKNNLKIYLKFHIKI